MDTYTVLIRKQIKLKFKTLENFSRHMGIPRTTLNFILKNGVGSSSYDMITRIFEALDIAPVRNIPVVISSQNIDLLKMYSRLDEIGKHTVLSVAEAEYRRINPLSPEDTVIAAYDGLSSNEQISEDEKAILDLVRKIKENSSENE